MTFPIYRAVEWQCRYVFEDKRCCGLKIGHDGEHVPAEARVPHEPPARTDRIDATMRMLRERAEDGRIEISNESVEWFICDALRRIWASGGVRRVPREFTEGQDSRNAQKAWLHGYDTAAQEARPAPPLDIDKVIQEVAELPDRMSPEDWPEAMLVTADELRSILQRAAPSLDWQPAVEELIKAARLAVYSLGDVQRVGWAKSVDPKRWAEQCAFPLLTAIDAVNAALPSPPAAHAAKE